MSDVEHGLPDFIIIGAAKAGTTSLTKYLGARLDVFMSTPKEIEFFARDDHYSQGIDWYRRFFAEAAPGQLKGEASTIYTLAPHFPRTAERIARHVPGAKLVYVLREPVSRAYSFYVQLQKNYRRRSGDGRIHRSFEDFLDAPAGRAPREKALAAHDAHLPDVPGLVVDGSDYLTQIQAYLAHFPRDRILFLSFEELRADPAAVFARLHDFLGLPAPEPGAVLPSVNITSTDFDRLQQDRMAYNVIGRVPALGRIAHLLPTGPRQSLRQLVIRTGTALAGRDGGTPPPMAPETKARLSLRFDEDRARLAELTGLDLDRWWTR